MFTLIENGDVYGPAPLGRTSVLLIDARIQKVGDVDARILEQLDLSLDVIDATGCFVTPGFIDPHQHLLGGSGEDGFSSQTPEINMQDIVAAGVTSVVGCLGVDTTMKTMSGLLSRAKALKEDGLSAFIWSGGYNVPPTTITNSLRNDIMFIELPALQPGSSIMPGKVNPAVAEMMNMVGFHVMGHHSAITQAAAAGQLELNVMMPYVAYALLESLQIVRNAVETFDEKCVRLIKAHREKLREYSERTVGRAALYNEERGFMGAAELAQAAIESGNSIDEVIAEE